MILKLLSHSLSRAEDNIYRLHSSAFEQASLSLLDAGLYDDYGSVVTDSIAQFNGYAEWVANTDPILSVGFDWSFRVGKFVFEGDPFSNFIIQSEQGEDLPNEVNLARIKAALERACWHEYVMVCLSREYR